MQTSPSPAFQPGQSNAIQSSVCCLVPVQTSQVSKSEQQTDDGCEVGMLESQTSDIHVPPLIGGK